MQLIETVATHPAAAVLYAPTMLSERGKEWLAQHPIALEALITYLADRNQSVFTDIVDNAKKQLFPLAETAPERDSQSGTYLEWLTCALASERQPAGIFPVDEGLFIAIPEGLDAFSRQSGIPVNTVRNRLIREEIHRVGDHQKFFDRAGYNGLILNFPVPDDGSKRGYRCRKAHETGRIWCDD